ncbi:NADH dehydrogenase (ubiquinone) B22 subunit [Calliopsis andreniformis]|uniref:NADH dehydrogenase (ubiquinone) B22 subunit n=1 Tax=Calliopsis andreniformis TaxID=337506 RepID=UPI003FCED4A4
MAQLPSELLTHSQKVCRLYKRALRSLKDWHPRTLEFRYQAVLLRKRFDENKIIPDARVAKMLLIQGEEEVFNKQHWQPLKFPNCIGGVAYDREAYAPDYLLDLWDPMEKAHYPKYFARREELKKEYEQLYYKWFPEVKKAEENEKN